MNRRQNAVHPIRCVLGFISNFSIYQKLSLLIMTVMLCSSLLAGWQSAHTLWQRSLTEQTAFAGSLLRLSRQKIEDGHQRLIQYKHLTIVRQRKMLQESLATVLPMLHELDTRIERAELSEAGAQSLALDTLKNYPNSREELFFVFNAERSLLFLPQSGPSANALLQARTFIGQNALATAKRDCLRKGNSCLTLHFSNERGQEQSYTGCFAYFAPWNWFVARLSSTLEVENPIAARQQNFLSELKNFLASIPAHHGQLVLLDRNSNHALFPNELDPRLLNALLRISLPAYGINRPETMYLQKLPDFGSSDLYSATYPGLKMQVLYFIPRTNLVETFVTLITKQAVIIFSLFIISIIAIFLILKRFTAPLIELTHFANELSNTYCVLPSPSLQRLEELSKRPPDETTRLAQSFLLLQRALSHRMQQLIKASHENQVIAGALHQLNQELDLRVQERTLQLEQANKELQAQEKKKTDFLSAVSHELRTPMTAISGFITMIKTRLEQKLYPLLQKKQLDGHIKRINRDLEIVSVECVRLSSLIDTVLDISKIESGNIQLRRDQFDLIQAIKHAVQTVSVLYEQAGIPLELDIPETLPQLTGDEDRIIQVVINLLSNALKYTHQGSVRCHVRQIGGSILLQVIDTGIGIPSDQLSAIFNKYIQLDESWNFRIKGTGLGLAICKMIVEAHGGSIRASSTVNKGSTFSVTLPLHSQADAPPPLTGESLPFH